MHYFVHHETRIVWAQPGAEPIVDDGMVGECDRPRFDELMRANYLDKTGEPAAVLHSIIIEEPDPWT